MRRVTNEDLNDIYYRSLLLSDRLEELEGIIDGTGTSFLPMITDESGKSVTEKADALADELLESLRHYLELEHKKLTDQEEEMYSCFLYCAMQMYRKKHNRYSSYTDIPGKFRDIIDAAKDVVSCTTRFESFRDFFAKFYNLCRLSCLRTSGFLERDTHRQEKYNMQSAFIRNGAAALEKLGYDAWEDEIMVFDPPQDLHIDLCEKFEQEHKDDENNDSYKRLAEDTENYIMELYEKREYYKTHPEVMNEYDFNMWLEAQYPAPDPFEDDREERERQKAKLRELGRRRSYKEYYKYDELKGCYPDDLDSLWRSIDYEHQWAKLDEWVGFISDKETLQKRFARFIQLYYDLKHSDFFNNVHGMVLSYLVENDLCSMAFGDDYGLVTHELRRAISIISDEIERVKEDNDIRD
ncbi:MAG: hypothetical protein J1F11_06405 [Oscillospiraceae bacterium]|nr:hypothetical protein [Oscillospiraceae bacterium]